jgi:sulfotransferase
MSATKKEFAIISGLPRTGSTLLVALLSQNPRIYGEGASALCQLMWDVQQTCDNIDAVAANRRFDTKHDIISALPELYYKNVKQPIVIEKGRTWTHPDNFDMWTAHVNSDQKLVVMVRPLEDVFKSIAALRLNNGWENSENLYFDLLEVGSEPICRAAEAIALAKVDFSERILFVDYRDLVKDPIKVLDSIYAFYGWEKFEHSLENITHNNQEDDTVHGLLGMHDIRDTISVRQIDVELPKFVKEACVELTALVYGS